MLSRRSCARPMETRASSPARLQLSSARRSAVRALPIVGKRAVVGAPPYRRRCPDQIPVEPGVAWARMMRRSMSSRHCLITSGEAARSGGLRSSSLAASNGSLGATCAGALGVCSAALYCAPWAAALGVGRREACGAGVAASSLIGWSWDSTIRAMEMPSGRSSGNQASPYLARQMSWCRKLQPGGGMRPPNPKCRMCLGAVKEC